MCNSENKRGARGRVQVPVLVRLCLLLVLGAALMLFGCMPYELRSILDGPQGKALSVSPSATVVSANSSISFSAAGGVAPYHYAVVQGGGTIDPVTGLYAAPVSAGTAVIRVTDKTGKSVDAAITIQAAGTALAISPAAITISVGASITFVPIGGTPSPSYTFSIQASPGSVNPAINAATGFYTAGNTPGLDKVNLTDGVSTVTANVTVVPTSTVDYTITGAALSATGTVSTALPGGQTFALKNVGTSAGTQTVTWNVYLSANTTLDAGDTVVASGTTGALAAGASNNAVAITGGAFPAVAPGAYYLIIQVSSNEDTTPGNNISAAVPVTLNPQNIDYITNPVSNTGPLIAGGVMTGTFTVRNQGTAAGGTAVLWQVRASADTTLDASDYIVAGGTIAALGASTTSATINISGSWPSTPGPWYLIAIAVSADDINHANDVSAATLVTTTGAPPADVEYTVQTVISTGGTTAGQALAGTFTYRNNNSAAGSQPVYWTAYVSADTTLQLGTDPVVDSGISGALGAATTSGTTSFSGTWPTTPGAWHLIIAISASDDLVPTNNTLSSAAATITAPNVDYIVTAVNNTGGAVAGDPLSGTFTYRNQGSQNGSQTVVWTAYISSDATLDAGDTVINSGVVPALTATTTSGAIPFTGTWPASAGARFLIISLTVAEDITPANNWTASGSVATTAPNVNYAVSGVANTGPTVAGGTLQGTVTITNVGAHAGTQMVPWRVYVSTAPTLGVGADYLVYSDFIASPGLASAGSTSPMFTAAWPSSSTNQNYYIIVEAAAADDVVSANNSAASGVVAVTGVAPNYSITAVVPPGGPNYTGLAANGTLTIQNTGNGAGAATVYYQVYASLGNNTYDTGDTLIASGSFGPLAASGSQTPLYAGTWPATPGTYYIIVRASTADDPTIADAASGSVAVTIPPQPDYSASFSAGIPWSGLVSTAINPSVNPWLTVQNLSANPGHATVTWAVYLSTDNVLDAGDTPVQTSSFGPLAGSGSASVAFVGNWPAAGGLYYLIATVQAADDGNITNNVVIAPRPIPVGNYRYVEGAEDNSGKGPAPNPTKTSDTLVTNLAPNQALVIEGTMDAYQGANSQYDTYKFTAGAGVNNLSFVAAWLTGFDDIDLYLWDTGSTNLNSIDTTANREPGGGTFDVTAVAGPRVCYISANFWLANNTSGSAGQKYVILVKGLP